ncbi:hypothetical protein V2G26_019621 [Clonostachys chloroleuca]
MGSEHNQGRTLHQLGAGNRSSGIAVAYHAVKVQESETIHRYTANIREEMASYMSIYSTQILPQLPPCI